MLKLITNSLKSCGLYLFTGLFLLLACNQTPDPEPENFGFLATTISVEITEEEANARTEAVNTDDFVLIIYDVGDNVIMTFDPFSTAPSEVQLPVGEYYVVAHSNDLVEAGFDNPYYFGRSANFTIDKEETKTVDIIATLANAKVAINYSTDVVNTFDIYEGTVTVTGSGTILAYVTGEIREGYFVTTSPLDVEVSLVYNRLDGTTIERSLTATISDPQPKTHYNINVDASLKDGKIIFNLTVDESFETIDIDLGGDASEFPLAENGFLADGVFYATSEAIFGCYELPGFSSCVMVFTDTDFFLCTSQNQIYIDDIASSGPISSVPVGAYDYSIPVNPGGDPVELQTFTFAAGGNDLVWTDDCDIDDTISSFWSSDIEGITGGNMTIEQDGENYTVMYTLTFTNGPEIQGSFVGPILYVTSEP